MTGSALEFLEREFRKTWDKRKLSRELISFWKELSTCPDDEPYKSILEILVDVFKESSERRKNLPISSEAMANFIKSLTIENAPFLENSESEKFRNRKTPAKKLPKAIKSLSEEFKLPWILQFVEISDLVASDLLKSGIELQVKKGTEVLGRCIFKKDRTFVSSRGEKAKSPSGICRLEYSYKYPKKPSWSNQGFAHLFLEDGRSLQDLRVEYLLKYGVPKEKRRQCLEVLQKRIKKILDKRKAGKKLSKKEEFFLSRVSKKGLDENWLRPEELSVFIETS